MPSAGKASATESGSRAGEQSCSRSSPAKGGASGDDVTSREVRSQGKELLSPRWRARARARGGLSLRPSSEGLGRSEVGPGRPAPTRLGQAGRRGREPGDGDASEGRRRKARTVAGLGKAQRGETRGSSMAGAEEVCTAPERETEPEATCAGGLSEGGEAKAKKSRCSRSSRAGLLFPVSRVDRQLRRGGFAERLGARAPVYLAAVLQWVTHKTMDAAGKISKKSKQQRILPSHLQAAVRKSSLLKKLLRGGVPRRGRRAVPRSRRVASPPKKETTESKKRRPRPRAAPARAIAAGK